MKNSRKNRACVCESECEEAARGCPLVLRVVQGEPLTCLFWCAVRARTPGTDCASRYLFETPARRIIGLMRRNPVLPELKQLIATPMYNTRKKSLSNTSAAVSYCHRYSPKDPRLRSTELKLSTLIRLNSATTRQRTIRKSCATCTCQKPE